MAPAFTVSVIVVAFIASFTYLTVTVDRMLFGIALLVLCGVIVMISVFVLRQVLKESS